MIQLSVTTPVVAGRIETAEAALWTSLVAGLAAIPGNPYEASMAQFGPIIALRCPAQPHHSFVNRILGAGPIGGTPLNGAIHFVREAGVACRIDVSPFAVCRSLLRHLAREGFHLYGFQMALYMELDATFSINPVPNVTVHLAETEAAQELAATTHRAALDLPENEIPWLDDSLRVTAQHPDWRTYVAYVDDIPAGVAQLHISGGVGTLSVAKMLPYYRDCGVQAVLVQHRIADAAAAGCNLVCAQVGAGTIAQRTLERAGLRIAYTKGEFYDRLP